MDQNSMSQSSSVDDSFASPPRYDDMRFASGTLTKMAQTIAETYARDPFFYSGTFCVDCRAHFPVGEDGEFIWARSNEKVGT